MGRKAFSLLEVAIVSGLLAFLFLAILEILDFARRAEGAQIRKSLLLVESKVAKTMITKDINSSLYSSIDVLQRNIDFTPGGTLETWNRYDNYTDLNQVVSNYGPHYKRCVRVPCEWYLNSGRETLSETDDRDRYPHAYSGMQYHSTGTSLSAMNNTISKSGRVWPGENTQCPIDQSPLVETQVPIKLVKMITANDRNGQFRRFDVGDNFAQPDWQGFIFYVNTMGLNATSGKIVRYIIYKDDLDLEPQPADQQTLTQWRAYENSQTMVPGVKLPLVPGEVEDGTLNVATGENFPPVAGIPTLFNLFDFNKNGRIEIAPNEFSNPTFLGATTAEGTVEKFWVLMDPSGAPKIQWIKRSASRQLTLEINLKTHQALWSFQINEPGGIVWSRTRNFQANFRIVANYVAQWDMMTRRASQPYWDPGFPYAPAFTNGVLVDQLVRLVIVFDYPYRESGQFLHEEFLLETGISIR